MRREKMLFATINLLEHWKSEKVAVSSLQAKRKKDYGTFKPYLLYRSSFAQYF